MVGWHHRLDGHEFEQAPGVGDGQGGQDFPGGPLVKNLPANAGVTGLIPGLGRFHMPWGN